MSNPFTTALEPLHQVRLVAINERQAIARRDIDAELVSRQPSRHLFPDAGVSALPQNRAVDPLHEEQASGLFRGDPPMKAWRPRLTIRQHTLVDERLTDGIEQPPRLGQPRLLVEASPIDLLHDERLP